MDTQDYISVGHDEGMTLLLPEAKKCPGGVVFKANRTCGCCFCEQCSCLCDWHDETAGYWN